jgi:hypothetical protein
VDPNSTAGSPRDYWVWLAPDWSDYQESEKAPAGKTGWTRVKVRETLYNDGRIVRNVLDAGGAPVSAEGTPAASPAAARALDATPQYDKEQQKRFKDAQTAATNAVPTPAEQRTAREEAEIARNAALPPEQDPRSETDAQRAARADARIKEQGAAAAKPATPKGDIQTIGGRIKEYNPATGAYDIDHGPSAAPKEPDKPQVVAGTLNTTSPNVGIVGPDGQTVTWIPNKNYQNPNPQPISIPGNPRVIQWDDGPGKPIRTEKNPAYIKPSKIQPHPSDPNRMVNVTEDDAGNPVILPVDDKTVIKPADLPVLQAKYGEIAQGLGALAQDLNSRYARGEITEKQKNDAFTAAHQQAQTQVSEINQILDTSKAIWSGELTQRGQSLGETQSRRGFAQNIFDRAAATGMGIATSAGPGHGKDIAAGVGALMNIGQRYAEGMGGFRESPEVALPPALQQARGIGIPGYGAAGAPPGPPGAQASPDQAAAAGAEAQRQQQQAGGAGLPPPIFRPPPPVDGALTPQAMTPGQDPRLAAMQQQLMGSDGFGGSPVAAGGLGVYDPTQDVSGMVGDGADPTWAEAVRRAAGELSQPGYAWQRFGQPASRYG